MTPQLRCTGHWMAVSGRLPRGSQPDTWPFYRRIVGLVGVVGPRPVWWRQGLSGFRDPWLAVGLKLYGGWMDA